jgi:hypothetical protein
VYTPGGTVVSTAPSASAGPGINRWRPTGSEDAPVLSPILAPLEPVKSKLLVIDGLDMRSAVGEQSQAGMIAWLTGSVQASSNGASGFATGPSLDQVIAPRLSAGQKKASLQLAVRWGTGRARGAVSPIDIVNFANDATFTPIAPSVDPVAIWTDLFGGLPDGAARRAQWDKSILDYVDRRYVKLANRLGSSDKQKLEQHLSSLRDLEKRVKVTAACSTPTLPDTTGYRPISVDGLNGIGPPDAVNDAWMPIVGRLMTDMMVMGMACNLTSVGTLQWSDSDARYSLPWLGLPETHNFYENGGGYNPVQLETIYTWYSAQHTYLLQQMDAVDLGDHSLLDESVVFFGSEVSHPATHVKTDMPFLLAGGGAGLRGGRWLGYDHRPHNDLLVSVLNLFGDSRTTFGTPQYCTGALTNLT